MNNLEAVQQLYQAFGQGDLPTLLAGLDPDVTWVNPGPTSIPYFGTHRGRDAVASKIFGFLASHLAFEVFEPREFFSSGDKVVALVHMQARALRTDQRVIQDAVHVFTLKAGKLIHLHDYQNSFALAEALRE